MAESVARVVWDMTFASKSLTGTRVLASELAAALRARQEYEIIEIAARNEIIARNGRAPSAGARAAAQKVWWLQTGLARRAAQQNAALLHAAAYLGPAQAGCPTIVNVFDTTYLDAPQDFDWKWKLYARWIPAALRNAAAILTLSEHSRRAIIRHYAVAPDKLCIVYPGINPMFHPFQDAERIRAARARYGLGSEYVLFVGAQEQRKNIPSLIRAVGMARAKLPALELALVGPRGRGTAAIAQALASSEPGSVRELGFVAQNDLPLLYAGARALVYASRLEGFGMPPLEAMACGTPVIAAPNPPLPEVLGASAWFTADDSPAGLAAGIQQALQDDALRASLRERGLRHARPFTWERAAQATAELYRETLKQTAARRA